MAVMPRVDKVDRDRSSPKTPLLAALNFEFDGRWFLRVQSTLAAVLGFFSPRRYFLSVLAKLIPEAQRRLVLCHRDLVVGKIEPRLKFGDGAVE
jgi:hypothetical protein